MQLDLGYGVIFTLVLHYIKLFYFMNDEIREFTFCLLDLSVLFFFNFIIFFFNVFIID